MHHLCFWEKIVVVVVVVVVVVAKDLSRSANRQQHFQNGDCYFSGLFTTENGRIYYVVHKKSDFVDETMMSLDNAKNAKALQNASTVG